MTTQATGRSLREALERLHGLYFEVERGDHRAGDHPDTCDFCAALSQPAASLDAAWAEAEAALPEGWRIAVQRTDQDFDVWAATGVSPGFFDDELGYSDDYVDGQGPTPAAALHSLAVRLREQS